MIFSCGWQRTVHDSAGHVGSPDSLHAHLRLRLWHQRREQETVLQPRQESQKGTSH